MVLLSNIMFRDIGGLDYVSTNSRRFSWRVTMVVLIMFRDKFQEVLIMFRDNGGLRICREFSVEFLILNLKSDCNMKLRQRFFRVLDGSTASLTKQKQLSKLRAYELLMFRWLLFALVKKQTSINWIIC